MTAIQGLNLRSLAFKFKFLKVAAVTFRFNHAVIAPVFKFDFVTFKITCKFVFSAATCDSRSSLPP